MEPFPQKKLLADFPVILDRHLEFLAGGEKSVVTVDLFEMAHVHQVAPLDSEKAAALQLVFQVAQEADIFQAASPCPLA